MSDTDNIPCCIRIGVTGHRALGNPNAVRTLMKRAIEAEIPRLFPSSSPIMINGVRANSAPPISYRVLSALAEGADRLVALAVLELPSAQLVAVLPLTIKDYLEDFSTEESKREFKKLLAQSRHPVYLRSRRIAEDCSDPAARTELRREAYRAAGEYVVDQSDVLIAVWNGEPARGMGSTAEIVEYALSQGRPVIRIWNGNLVHLNPGETQL